MPLSAPLPEKPFMNVIIKGMYPKVQSSGIPPLPVAE